MYRYATGVSSPHADESNAGDLYKRHDDVLEHVPQARQTHRDPPVASTAGSVQRGFCNTSLVSATAALTWDCRLLRLMGSCRWPAAWFFMVLPLYMASYL